MHRDRPNPENQPAAEPVHIPLDPKLFSQTKKRRPVTMEEWLEHDRQQRKRSRKRGKNSRVRKMGLR